MVDKEGKSIFFNRRFGEIWNIPQNILDTMDDEKMLQYVRAQLKYPDRFIANVKYLYKHKNEKSRDEIEFKDGKVFDRYSSPLVGPKGEYFGRVWYFRDVTEQKKAEQELKRLTGELEQKVEERTKELQARMEELERFNRLAVGRELKMIELKKRIKELEENLKKT